jgi:hypothetical protein
MDHDELRIARAAERIAELRRQADRWRLASQIPGRTAGRRRDLAPASPCRAGRHGPVADGADRGRWGAVAAASGPGEQPRRKPC